MVVILHYDRGFPTQLSKQHRLAQMIVQSGPPSFINGWQLIWVYAVGRFAASWDYLLRNPWPGDTRKLVRVEVR